MSSLNDFATTYMCQSLPFGGVKHSGFDRFAGIEGLRGMCIPKVWWVGGRWLHTDGRLAVRVCSQLAHTNTYLVVWSRAAKAALHLQAGPQNVHRRCLNLPRCPPSFSRQAVAEDRWPFKTAIPPLLQARPDLPHCPECSLSAMQRVTGRCSVPRKPQGFLLCVQPL